MKLLSLLLLSCWAIAAQGAAVKTRISNQGEQAEEGEFPYLVSIKIGVQQHCGGSLISKQHVLTAAHCVHPFVEMGKMPETMTVEVGTTRLGEGKVYGVKRISYNRKYKGETKTHVAPNDIAVIHLAKPVDISDNALAELPTPNTPMTPGTEVFVSGFGKSDVNGPTSTVLKKMEAKITPLEECKVYYKEHLDRIVSNDKICAAKGPGYGACQGDSGGPLVDKTKKKVLGVVSAGDGKCSNGQPDTYTDVSQFITYINEELKYDLKNRASGNQNPGMDLDGSTDINSSPSGYPPMGQNPWQDQFLGLPNLYPDNPFYPPVPGWYPGAQPQYPPNPFGPLQPIVPGQEFLGIPQWYPGVQVFPDYGKK